jgi:transcriptional regulator with PAS, ATPase and Fis domain
VGAARARQVDVRVLAATNRDLPQMVEDGKFREDLWFRLNVVRILIPPLRDRRGDVPLLARFFLNKYNARYKNSARLMESGIKALQEFTWPGNVRQLQHLIERLTILAPHDRIDADAVQHAIAAMDAREETAETLVEAEEEQIRRVLSATGGNKSRAAQILGIERKTLYRKLERMKL